MTDYSSDFMDQNAGPEPWSADKALIKELVRWLETTCLLPGHQLRPAETIQGPERWREYMAALLRQGRSHASIAARDDVLLVIEQTEPGYFEKLPAPKEHLDTPDVQIAEGA